MLFRNNAMHEAQDAEPRIRYVVLTLLLTSLLVAGADAQEVTDSTADTAATATKEGESVRPTLELGSFKIHDLRPTRNETAKVTFTIHLAFANRLTQRQVAQLQSWNHRFRDQVIIGVRITQTKDFQEPDLRHLRRNILIRVNRLLKAKLVEEVLITEYLFRTQ